MDLRVGGLLDEAERALAMVRPHNAGAKLAKIITASWLGERRTTKSRISLLVAGNVIAGRCHRPHTTGRSAPLVGGHNHQRAAYQGAGLWWLPGVARG